MGQVAEVGLECRQTGHHFPVHLEGGHAVRHTLFGTRDDLEDPSSHLLEGGAFRLVELGEVTVDFLDAHGQADAGPYCTTMRVLPSGSRNQNIGGTGSPIRLTSVSTSTPD